MRRARPWGDGLAAAGAAAGLLALAACLASSCGEGPGGLGKEWKYDVEKYRNVDPKLIGYEEKAPIETGFEDVAGLATGPGFAPARPAAAAPPRDRIYVAGDRAVRVFDPAGTRQAEVALQDRPRAIAVAPNGTAYVAVRRTAGQNAVEHVEVIGPDGRPAGAWPDLGPRSRITGIAAADECVFLADAGDRVVLHCDPSGRVLKRIGETGGDGEGGEGFKVPSPYFDLAVGPGKVLWIVNPGRRRVEAWSFEGCAGFWWGRASPAIEDFSGCCNPAHLAIGPDGTFVTAEKGLVRVKTYTAEGRFRSVVAPPAAFAKESGPPDVAMDSAGRVLVLDPGARTVRVFAPRAAAAGKEP
jgi:hypothetical protein